MQPVQLSLIPDPSRPRSPPICRWTPMVEQLPADAVATAIMLLAHVIAKAATPTGSRWSAMSESKVTTAHRRRAAVVYVRQSTVAQHRRNRESTTRQYDLVARAVELGWPRSRGAGDRRRPRDVRRQCHGSVRVRRARRPGRAGPGGNRVGIGGVATGPQQRRLVSAAGLGRDDRHADRRRRRRLPSGLVQRPHAARYEGHHVGGRTAHPARPPRRRHPQPGRPRRAAPRAAGRAGVG